MELKFNKVNDQIFYSAQPRLFYWRHLINTLIHVIKHCLIFFLRKKQIKKQSRDSHRRQIKPRRIEVIDSIAKMLLVGTERVSRQAASQANSHQPGQNGSPPEPQRRE